jgi:hypothetical protein
MNSKSIPIFEELTMPGFSLLNPINNINSNKKVRPRNLTKVSFSFFVSNKNIRIRPLKRSALENQMKFILLKMPNAKTIGKKYRFACFLLCKYLKISKILKILQKYSIAIGPTSVLTIVIKVDSVTNAIKMNQAKDGFLNEMLMLL